jgi:hypothetical protein
MRLSALSGVASIGSELTNQRRSLVSLSRDSDQLLPITPAKLHSERGGDLAEAGPDGMGRISESPGLPASARTSKA